MKLGEVCDFLDHLRKPVNQSERDKRIIGKSPKELFPYYGANGQAGWIDDYIFDEPLVLLAEDGGAFGSPNIPIAYSISGKTWVNNHAHVLRPLALVDFDFICASISIRPDLGKIVTGNTRPKLNQELAIKIPVPLPPLPEQKRIAAILKEQIAAIDKARKAAEERLAAVKALPAAFLRQVFPQPGQPLPEGWRWVKLGEVCEQFTGIRDPRKQPETKFFYVDISSVDNIKKKIVSPNTIVGINAPSRARQIIKTNDILVATTRPNLNAVAIITEDLNNQICSTGFCVLRPLNKIVDPMFVFAFVQSECFINSLTDLVKGALYPAVTDKQVKFQLLSLPPLQKQQSISAILREQMAVAEKARLAAEEELATINSLPAAILRKAFNGEI